jgi:hypothetical protein
MYSLPFLSDLQPLLDTSRSAIVCFRSGFDTSIRSLIEVLVPGLVDLSKSPRKKEYRK